MITVFDGLGPTVARPQAGSPGGGRQEGRR